MFAHGDIRFLVGKGLEIEALSRLNSAIFKDFIKYYTSS
jgi:hypothetical protein